MKNIFLLALTWFLALSACTPQKPEEAPVSREDSRGLSTASSVIELPGFTVKDAYVTSGSAGGTTGAFFSITNNTGAAECMASVTTEAAGVVQVHQTVMEKDVMTMHEVPCIEMGTGETVELKHGGLHIMLVDLKKDLIPGDSVELTFNFDHSGVRKLSVPIIAK